MVPRKSNAFTITEGTRRYHDRKPYQYRPPPNPRCSDRERSSGGGKGEGEGEGERPYVRPQTTTKLEVPEDGELLQDGTVRINVWASPRSLSTALMYSFAQVRAVLFDWFALITCGDNRGECV